MHRHSTQWTPVFHIAAAALTLCFVSVPPAAAVEVDNIVIGNFSTDVASFFDEVSASCAIDEATLDQAARLANGIDRFVACEAPSLTLAEEALCMERDTLDALIAIGDREALHMGAAQRRVALLFDGCEEVVLELTAGPKALTDA